MGLTLEAGDRLLLKAPSEATLLYVSGRIERVSRSITIPEQPAAVDEGLLGRWIRTLRQIASTDLRQQPNRQGMIRPIPGVAVAISPRNGTTVAGPRLTFIWTAIPGVEAYRLQLAGPNGARARYSTGADTVWALPPGEPALAPGFYSWTVAGEFQGRPADVQRFRVAGPDEVVEVDQALSVIREAGLKGTDGGLLLQAIAYRDAGMMYDSRAALDLLAAGGLRLDRSVYLLEADVLDGLGDLDGAAAALEQAVRAPL